VQQSTKAGFSWCNDTGYVVMAALGVEDKGGLTTRGWYRIEPGKCLKPEISGQPQRIYSFGEAVDRQGRIVRRGVSALTWGGTTMLCTREVRFELSEHTDCAGNGLSSTGFARIEGSGPFRFQEP